MAFFNCNWQFFRPRANMMPLGRKIVNLATNRLVNGLFKGQLIHFSKKSCFVDFISKFNKKYFLEVVKK